MRKREPRGLTEALGHIEKVGSLSTMHKATMMTIGGLWNFIQDNKLATLTKEGNLLWVLTDAGRERLARETPPRTV